MYCPNDRTGGKFVSSKMNLFLSLFAATLFGFVAGLYAQSTSGAKLAKLSEEKADITKMDLILLNTRVAVFQEILKDELSLPLIPTNITYDSEKQKIRTSVYVDPAFLAKVNVAQLSKTLDSRATALCIAPALAEGNFHYMFPVQPATEYCVIRFFTHALDGAGHVQAKDVATFEDGTLRFVALSVK
jgi:hypothetical protein